MFYADALGIWFRSTMDRSWHWFLSLNFEESFIVLGLTAAVGLMCMRGFGSRKHH